MAVNYNNSTHWAWDQATLTPEVSGNTGVGSMLVATLYWDATKTVTAVPPGFTMVGSVEESGGLRAAVYVMVVTASDGTGGDMQGVQLDWTQSSPGTMFGVSIVSLLPSSGNPARVLAVAASPNATGTAGLAWSAPALDITESAAVVTSFATSFEGIPTAPDTWTRQGRDTGVASATKANQGPATDYAPGDWTSGSSAEQIAFTIAVVDTPDLGEVHTAGAGASIGLSVDSGGGWTPTVAAGAPTPVTLDVSSDGAAALEVPAGAGTPVGLLVEAAGGWRVTGGGLEIHYGGAGTTVALAVGKSGGGRPEVPAGAGTPVFLLVDSGGQGHIDGGEPPAEGTVPVHFAALAVDQSPVEGMPVEAILVAGKWLEDDGIVRGTRGVTDADGEVTLHLTPNELIWPGSHYVVYAGAAAIYKALIPSTDSPVELEDCVRDYWAAQTE